MPPEFVYKIVLATGWNMAIRENYYSGSPDDIRDGFIHLSTFDQLIGTLEKHFHQQPGLVLVCFAVRDLQADLRWEPSRGGDLFPHFYGRLPTTLARWQAPIPLTATGHHQLPEQAS